MTSPQLLRPLRSLAQAEADIERSRRIEQQARENSELAEAARRMHHLAPFNVVPVLGVRTILERDAWARGLDPSAAIPMPKEKDQVP
jgi:hypothetical protein